MHERPHARSGCPQGTGDARAVVAGGTHRAHAKSRDRGGQRGHGGADPARGADACGENLASTETGAAKVEQYHRALFAVSCDELRKEIQRLTGRKVREAAFVVEPATGAIVHAFTSGTVVQIFQLEPHGVATQVSAESPPDDRTAPA